MASGGTPNRADIIIKNDTPHDLRLNVEEKCDCYEEHKGFMATNGKFVKGKLPPAVIKEHSMGRFSVSGREASAVAPNGKVFYYNKEENLKVVFTWHASGFTTRADPVADCGVTGKPAPEERGFFTTAAVPWSETLECDANPKSWIYTLRVNQGGIAEAVKAVKDLNKKDIKVFLNQFCSCDMHNIQSFWFHKLHELQNCE